MSTQPIDPSEIARFAAVEAARQLLPVGREYELLDRFARLAARLLHVPTAQVSLLTEVQTAAAGSGLAEGVIGSSAPLEHSICRYTAAQAAPLAIPDAAADPRFVHIPLVKSGELGAYLGVPLTTAVGDIVGAFCVFGPGQHLWNEAETQMLSILAEFVQVELEVAARTRALDEHRARWELAVEAGDLGSFDWNLTTGVLTWDDTLMAIFGYDTDGAGFDRSIASLEARVHPEDADAVLARIDESISTISSLHLSFRILLPDGRVRWMDARGRTLADSDGTAVRLIGVAWDVSEDHESEAHADQVLSTMSVGYLGLDADWRVRYVNPEASRLTGSSVGDLVGRTIFELYPDSEDAAFDAYRRVARTREAETVEAYYPEPLNAWFEIRVTPEADGIALYFLDISQRRRYQELLQLSVDMSEQMLATVDIHAAMAALATSVVPLLADWSIVSLVDDDGARDVVSWHRDPALRPVVQRYAEHRLDDGGSGVVDIVLRTGRPVPVLEDGTGFGLRTLPSPEAREALVQLAPETSLTVPMMSGDRVAGLLTLCRGVGRPAVTDQEVGVLLAICRRAGLAIDNARLYAEQAAASARDRTVAQALQRAMLTTLPQPEHLQLAARYRTAADGDQVGGDWYDAVVRPGESTTVMIGDVVGHDITAAAAMGQLRTMLRMLALRADESPSEILRGLDRAAEDLRLDTLATVLAARIEATSPASGSEGAFTVRWSNAGHPPPILLHNDGTVELLDGPLAELMVGVDADVARTDHTHVLPPDSTLLLYTDGLIERRGEDLDKGVHRLVDALQRHHALDADALLDQVLADTLDDQPSDDVAVLAVRLQA